jgi:hypothetical protein
MLKAEGTGEKRCVLDEHDEVYIPVPNLRNWCFVPGYSNEKGVVVVSSNVQTALPDIK